MQNAQQAAEGARAEGEAKRLYHEAEDDARKRQGRRGTEA
jgi:hypothetical protein